MEPELVALSKQAQDDPDAVALVLFGSAAAGSAHEESDLDVWYVRRREPLPPRERRGRLEIIPTTVELLRTAPDWMKPALAYGQVIWDETGELESVLGAARTISHEETAELYDGYLNDFYRSMKAWRRGNELAGRIECLAHIFDVIALLGFPVAHGPAGAIGEMGGPLIFVDAIQPVSGQVAVHATVAVSGNATSARSYVSLS